ncbi:MAG: bifunctional oligoribonuclease/PAP phosphatase NrnA [Candidatus Wallbacteria bacterium]|nr:bifunctional oligoribonuclease/PAP phosphatase NrnA [Candidatus Wallbacteria bacterium]
MSLPEEKFDYLISSLQSCRSCLVVTHEFPDGDAVGSLCAMVGILSGRYPALKVQAFIKTPIPETYDFLGAERFIKTDVDFKKFDQIIILDCGNLSRTGIGEQIKGQFLVNFDHHGDNDNFGRLNYVFPEASSTCEILCFLAGKLLKEPFPAEISRPLFTGILTDTGSFRFSCTSHLTHEAVSGLYRSQNAGLDAIIRKIYFEEPYPRMKLLGAVLNGMVFESGICYAEITREIWEETGTDPKNVEGLINYMSGIKNVELAILFQELPGIVKVSLRSHGTVDCQKLARKYNGGGHVQAAGIKIEGQLYAVRNEILKHIKEQLK